MPDLERELHRDLDADLALARGDLLAQITVPELGVVREQALMRRRQRRRAAAAAAAVVAVIAGTGAVLGGPGWPGDSGGEIGATPSATATLSPRYTGAGLKVYSFSADYPPKEVDGSVHQAQFTDSAHGYALITNCSVGACSVSLAVTADGGRTWESPDWLSPPPELIGDRTPTMLAVGGGVLLVGRESWFAAGPADGFMRTDRHDNPTTVIPDGARLWAGSRDGEGRAADAGTLGSTCEPGPVQVWLPDGWLADLATQPAMDVCWVAPARSAAGAWWVGGTAGGRPAVGVTHDAGRSWEIHRLPPAGPNRWAKISTLGDDAFAVVVSERRTSEYPGTVDLHDVYRSADGGPFTPYVGGQDSVGTTLNGDVVPLADGRLLAAAPPAWQISPGMGQPFVPAGGTLPDVARLQRTPGAWVAYDLVGSGYTAISTDGVNWQKIHLH